VKAIVQRDEDEVYNHIKQLTKPKAFDDTSYIISILFLYLHNVIRQLKPCKSAV